MCDVNGVDTKLSEKCLNFIDNSKLIATEIETLMTHELQEGCYKRVQWTSCGKSISMFINVQRRTSNSTTYKAIIACPNQQLTTTDEQL